MQNAVSSKVTGTVCLRASDLACGVVSERDIVHVYVYFCLSLLRLSMSKPPHDHVGAQCACV